MTNVISIHGVKKRIKIPGKSHFTRGLDGTVEFPEVLEEVMEDL